MRETENTKNIVYKWACIPAYKWACIFGFINQPVFVGYISFINAVVVLDYIVVYIIYMLYIIYIIKWEIKMGRIKSFLQDWLDSCGYELGYDMPDRLPELRDIDSIRQNKITYDDYKGVK